MLKTIKLTNLLSFGAETEITFNEGLNVLIGANGSGKSNLIEAISLLQAMPKDLNKAIRGGGGIGIEEWLWKGVENPIAKIEIILEKPKSQPLRHTIEFRATNYRVEVVSESIAKDKVKTSSKFKIGDFIPDYYYRYNGLVAFANQQPPNTLDLHWDDIEPHQSILAQRHDPSAYPEMTYLGDYYEKIHLYREWQFGRTSLPRTLQRADLPNDFLEENNSNLALILNTLRQNKTTKTKLLDALKLFNESIEDFDIRVQGGFVEIFFQESDFNHPIPASRLSDGTLRYLSLLAILLHPNPPPLICIEEPELGLHPDILPSLIDLLKEAAQKTQIIITTHSADLIDDLTDMPEAVLVFDKHQGSTTVNRLDKTELNDWLKDYRLGQLWRSGDLGGNRW